jgi:hypothetical protein
MNWFVHKLTHKISRHFPLPYQQLGCKFGSSTPFRNETVTARHRRLTGKEDEAAAGGFGP